MLLAEADWGGLSETQDQEFVFAVVPQELGEQPLAELICAKDVHAIVNNIWIQVMNVTGDSDWFARNAGIVTGYRDNFLEIYQPSAFQDHRIGTIRAYDVGALITRIWILEPLFDARSDTASITSGLRYAERLSSRRACMRTQVIRSARSRFTARSPTPRTSTSGSRPA